MEVHVLTFSPTSVDLHRLTELAGQNTELRNLSKYIAPMTLTFVFKAQGNLQKPLQRISFKKCAAWILSSNQHAKAALGLWSCMGMRIKATDNFFILPLQW
jgi:hypothetical protein